MKYLRSLMQQSVTACKNQAKLIQQFTLSLLYLLIIHIVALLFFFLFRLVLFTSIDYQFPPDIQNNFLMQATAFIKGLWFDNVIACYILLLPLVILWITALCNYHSKWVFRFISIFFILFYSLSFIISAANIPYFSYFFKTINSSIYNWFGYGATTAGMVLGGDIVLFPYFSRTDIYSSAVRKCTTVIFLFLSSHQFEIYFHQPDKPPMYIRRRCCLYRTLSIRNTGTHGI